MWIDEPHSAGPTGRRREFLRDAFTGFGGLALASMMHNLGALLRQIGEMDKARATHESAIAIWW